MAVAPNAASVYPRAIFAWLVAAALTLAPSRARADAVVAWMAVAEQAQFKIQKNDRQWRTAAPAGGVTLPSHNPGMTIRVPTWKAFVDEMSMSRIYAGAHTRMAVEAAEAIARRVARRALAGVMQLTSRPPSSPAK